MSVKIQFGFASKHIAERLARLKEKSAKVEKRTLYDIKKRIPGIVSEGVCRVYQIKKSEVVKISRYQNGELRPDRGRNTGKGAVSSHFRGETIATLSVVFRGRVHAEWPTKPKRRPKGRKVIVVNGQRRVVPKPYQVTIETFRGHPAVVKPAKGNRVFVVDGRNRAFIVGKDNKPLIKASTSVPQAIKNPKSRKIWQRSLNDKLKKRFEHNFNQIMKE